MGTQGRTTTRCIAVRLSAPLRIVRYLEVILSTHIAVRVAYPERGAHRWQVGPYVTWNQSPFVRYRLEYNHEDGHGMEDAEDRIMLQMIFAAGPHKHERY